MRIDCLDKTEDDSSQSPSKFSQVFKILRVELSRQGGEGWTEMFLPDNTFEGTVSLGIGLETHRPLSTG